MSAAKALPAALSLALTSLVLAAPAVHAESYLQLNTSVDYSSGDYGVAAFGGRRFNGSSDSFVLRDVWLAGAGAYVHGERTIFGLDYDWREGATLTSPDVSELTGSVTCKLSEKLRLQGYSYTGLADGSPDLGGGVQVPYRFGGN